MNTDLLFENARLQGRVITLEAEVKCLEAVVRSHERVDCLRIKSLDEQLKQAEAENARLKAEVERLTKAGDYLQRDVRLLSKDLLGKNPPTRHSEMEWNAAKEVQS